MQLIVLGMYRSGTSLATRILNKMGAYVPPECFSDSPDIEAPREDWDKQDIRKLNNSMLLAANAVWHRIADFDVTKIPSQVKEKFRKKAKELVLELDTHRPWVINDPRLCLIFPLLRPLLELPICILVHRKPIQVAQSLQYHDGFPITFGMALWEKYTLSALTSSVELPRVSLCFEKIMDNPLEATKQLYTDLCEFEVRGLIVPGEEEIKSLIDADLHDQHGDLNLQGSFINVYQDRLYRTINGERIEEIKSLHPLSLQALEAMFHFEAMEKLEADKKRMQFEIHEQNDALRIQKKNNALLNSKLQEQGTALLAKDKELIEYKFQVDSTKEELNKYQAEIASTKEELKTCKNETERFRTLVLSKEQALSYKEKELMSVQNESVKLKRKLHEVDMAMQAQTKKLNMIEGRSEQRKYSIHKLSHWLNKLDSDFKLLKSSRRWQMGNALIRTLEFLLLRRKAPIVTDHIAGIFAEFEDWKNSEHPKKKR